MVLNKSLFMTNTRSITFTHTQKHSNTRAIESEGETRQYMVFIKLGLKRDPHRCQQQKTSMLYLKTTTKRKREPQEC